jgi:hypothetical protein
VPEERFEQAHALLDQALPGRGDVPARYRAWRTALLVPRERLGQGLERLAGAARARCREIFDLPAGERVTWELTSGEAWAANAAYVGQRRTVITVNVDFPISSHRLLELVCHEAYPGHHTESVVKEASLIEKAGREELAVYVYPSPQALVSEGIGCLALRALLGADAENFAAEALRPLRIPYDPETGSAVREAEERLLPLRSNVALMLDEGASGAEARDYAHAWLLDDPREIDAAITALETRSWSAYESCYPVGLALCQRYTAGHRDRFRDLLCRQLTPAGLRSATDH